MQYELNIEEVSDISRKLHITVAATEVDSELNRAFKDLKRKVRLPGFRPGKVPQQMLEARFGAQVKGEVSGKLIEASYREAIDGLDVTGRPEVEARGEVSRGGELTFTIAVAIRPQVKVKGHKGVAVEMPVAKVTKADVDSALNRQLGSQARIEEVTENRAVAVGDMVVTALSLKTGDEVIAEEEGTMLHTGMERYYPGVEGLLVGMKKGESKTEDVTIGDDAGFEHLQGVSCSATVEVIGIQETIIPELDDALAEKLGFEGGAKGARAAIKAQLTTFAEDSGKNAARVQILEKLVETNTFEIPDGMVQEQMSALIDELRSRRSYMGQDPDGLRLNDAEVADLKTRAAFAARAGTILSGVARQESIEATEDDVAEKLQEIADSRGQDIEAVRAMVAREGATEMIKARILEEKTLEWLLDNAKVTKTEPKKESTAKKAPAKKASAKKTAEAAPAGTPEWNAKMKKDDLLAVAKELGLDVNTKMKKAEIVSVLQGA
jgi:trigger factor